VEGVFVRALEAEDAVKVAELERSMFSDPWSEDTFRQEARGGPAGWSRVAVEAGTGEIVAYLVAWFVADEVHLANVAVVPRVRRRGLAQRLLDELESEGRRREARMVILEVRRSNQAAQELYRRNGYYSVSIRRRYYRDNREDALVMIKPLGDAEETAPRAGA
jgi:ribosomal-protein-alanine N-acetyltransferase